MAILNLEETIRFVYKSPSMKNHQLERLEKLKKDYSIDDALTSDDNVWHEKQVSTKKVVKQKIEELVQSFTIHGLTRVCTAEKLEASFWLFMLLAGLTCCSYIIHNLTTRYTDRDIYAQISSKVAIKNYFPSVTFCESTLLFKRYFQYCYLQKGMNNSLPCTHRESHEAKVTIDQYPNKYWSNQFFNVTRCTGWDGQNCINNSSLLSLKHHKNTCFTWNYAGDIYDIYGHVEIAFTFNDTGVTEELKNAPNIIALIHDPEVLELDITKKVEIEPFKTYEITIDKTMLKRLPSPFPSKCTNEKKGDIFPGKYARRSCIESENYIDMYKKCGDIFDYIRGFIPNHIKKNYTRFDSIEKVTNCFEKNNDQTKEKKDCPFPCEEMDIAVLSTFHERQMKQDGNASIYRINLQYQRVDSVRMIEEKEMYSWYQMMCEIGGFVGLVIGASVISLVEVFTYITLVIVNKWFL